MNKAVVSWSGGKDSYYAFLQSQENGVSTVVLLNVLNEEGKISRSHGIPVSILAAQAAALSIPLKTIASSWQQYEQNFINSLTSLKKEYGLTTAVFGDIDLAEHKAWEEQVCEKAGLNAHLPLWRKHRKSLVLEMLQKGVTAIIVSCNQTIGERFLGQQLTPQLVTELEALGIDPCGEEGEFHTLIVDGPLFASKLNVSIVNTQLHENYWFAELA